jgi:hypothetical protein
MTAPTRVNGTVLFEPHALHEMAVAYENVCSAIPERFRTKALRDVIARRIIMLASGSKADSVELYLTCVSSLRAHGQIPI